MPERIKTTKKRYCESSRSIYNPYPFVLPRIIRNNKKKKKKGRNKRKEMRARVSKVTATFRLS